MEVLFTLIVIMLIAALIHFVVFEPEQALNMNVIT